MKQETSRGTRAHAPDQGWCQVRETVLMLQLAAGQVEAAMRDSNSSVEVLTETFISMENMVETIESALGRVRKGTVKEEIRDSAREIAHKMHQSIVAFQFYDKLMQRLDHVCHGLANLSALLDDKTQIHNPAAWLDLQEKIKSKYAMAEERAMFDAVMAGATVEEALKTYMAARMQQVKQSGGEIELF